MADQPSLHPGTLALHAGQVVDPTTTSRAVPIYATTAYVFNSPEHAANLFGLREFGNIYTRLMNPTNDVLEKRLAALDGGAAGLVFASRAGRHYRLFADHRSCRAELHFRHQPVWRNMDAFQPDAQKARHRSAILRSQPNPETLSKLVDKNTRAVYIESIGNPKNDVPDYRKLTDIAHSHGLPAIIDNTVLTPALFRPIEHGFDIVVYSTTKFIAGHGVHIGGAIVDSGKFPWAKDPAKWPEFTAPDPSYHGMVFEEALRPIGNIAYILYIRTHWLRDTGGCQSPFGSFLTLLGLETLHLRMQRHTQNALAVAQFLAKTSGRRVGELSGPARAIPTRPTPKNICPTARARSSASASRAARPPAKRSSTTSNCLSHLANIGDAKSLIIHPARPRLTRS